MVRLPFRGPRTDAHDHGRRGRLGRRNPADQRVLRRHADDRADEPDGDRSRRSRQPQLRRGVGISAEHADPAGRLQVRLGQRRRSGHRASRPPNGRRRLRHSRSAGSSSASSASPTRTPRRWSSPARSTRSRDRRDCAPSSQRASQPPQAEKIKPDHRHGPSRRHGRHAERTRPVRPSTSPTTSTTSTRHRRPHGSPGAEPRPNGTFSSRTGARACASRGSAWSSTRQPAPSSTSADFHKPWTIGVTPDPAIQARDQRSSTPSWLPILGTVIGHSIMEILRVRLVRARGRPPVRVARRERGHGRDARPVCVDRRRSSRSPTRVGCATG